MPGREDDKTRIDLMHYDKSRKKIVAVEVKLIQDHRLYSDEIIKQLQKYHNFMKTKATDIASAYLNVIRVKKALGLLEDETLIKLENHNLEVENRILLCLIGYNQVMINIFKEKRLKEIVKPDIMLGVYFFGKDGGDLNSHTGKNKIIFA